MAIKKSDLYSSLWKSCDQLRGGMDASQYKDYVLVLLFVKYVSDRYAGRRDALLDVPPGARFADMVAVKGDTEIGDKINKIIGKLADANDLKGVIDVADFNDPDKLGKGKEMVDRLSNLVAIFDDPALDFRGNRAEGDDLIGDAYEYLMRHFATESGKSQGQFYTPAEVSRVMAKVVGAGSRDGPARVLLRNRTTIELHAQADSSAEHRERTLQRWYRMQLRELVPPLLDKWQRVLGVRVASWGIQRMKTKWGGCNSAARRIWLNLELAKKPTQCLEYLIVHELIHLIERHHNDHFVSIMDKNFPQWRMHRETLNSAPLAHETWSY